jgi:hypothetical protein
MPKRALQIGIVLLTVMVMHGPSAGQSLPNRDDLCDPLWIRRLPAAQDGEVVLPVIVHYMKSTDPRHGDNDVTAVFRQPLLRRYFSGRSFINGTVWRQADIRLFLHRIEVCRYDPAFTGQLPNQPEEIPSPSAGSDGPELFRRVNSAYNYQIVPGLDLYVWWEIGGLVVGHARPYHLSSGAATTGAVWVDTQCLNTPEMAARCERLIAHEAGHFLGLCHVCKVAGDSESQCTACVPSFPQLPDCASSDAPRDSIMRSRYDGRTLNACEIGRAVGEARSRVGSTPP